MVSAPTVLRSNINPNFPATVTGSGPVSVSKQNGVWTVQLNINALGQITSLPPGSLFMAYNPNPPAGWIAIAATLGGSTYRLTSNFASTNQAVPQPTGVSFTLSPGRYYIRGYLPITGGVSSGANFNLSLGSPGAFTYCIFSAQLWNNVTGIVAFAQSTGALPSLGNSGSGNPCSIYFDSEIDVSVAGVVSLNFSQNTSNANTSTLLQGATITVIPLAN